MTISMCETLSTFTRRSGWSLAHFARLKNVERERIWSRDDLSVPLNAPPAADAVRGAISPTFSFIVPAHGCRGSRGSRSRASGTERELHSRIVSFCSKVTNETLRPEGRISDVRRLQGKRRDAAFRVSGEGHSRCDTFGRTSGTFRRFASRRVASVC